VHVGGDEAQPAAGSRPARAPWCMRGPSWTGIRWRWHRDIADTPVY